MKRTLVLDMGGSSIKAGLFDGKKIIKTGEWRHNYSYCGLPKAKSDLFKKAKKFCNGKIDYLGIGVAGLLATDESLFRSTVLTSFQWFNIAEYLKDKLKAKKYSIHNDADCGAIGEYYFCKKNFFYVVIGSGIGSACVDSNGKILYLVRIDKKRKYFEKMNYTPSDIGLKSRLKTQEIKKIFTKLKIKISKIEAADFNDIHDKTDEVRIGHLGSAVGVSKILEILWDGKFNSRKTRNYYLRLLNKDKKLFKDFLDKKYAAKSIAFLAKAGDIKCRQAYKLMGRFLGLAIAKGEKVILKDYCRYFPVRLGGEILESKELFWREMIAELKDNNVDVQCTVSKCFLKGVNPNIFGAFLSVNNLKKHGWNQSSRSQVK